MFPGVGGDRGILIKHVHSSSSISRRWALPPALEKSPYERDKHASITGGRLKRSERLTFLVVFSLSVLITVIHSRTLAMEGMSSGSDIRLYAYTYETQSLEAFSREYLWVLANRVGLLLELHFSTWLEGILITQALLWMLFGWQAAISLGVQREFAPFALPITLVLLYTYPFLVSGQTNVLRTGLAVPLGSLALLAFVARRRFVGSLLLATSLGFHFEVGVIMAAGLVAYTLLSRRGASITVITLAIVYALGLSTLLAGALLPSTVTSAASQYGLESEYRSGVRLDFLLFTLAIVGGNWLLSRSFPPRSFGNRALAWLVGLSIPFLLLGGQYAYSDRYILPLWAAGCVLIAALLYGRVSSSAQLLIGTTSLIGLAVIVLLATQ